MKKKLIYPSALAALLSASSILAGGPEIVPVEDYFSGFYVGGTGSVHQVDFDGDASVNISDLTGFPIAQRFITPGTVFSTDADGSSVDGYGGAQGGFGWTFNHLWYLGVQGWGEWGNQESTSQNLTGPIQTNSPFGFFRNTFNANQTTTVKLKNDYGVAGKFGYLVAPRTLVYGKVGASWANLQVSNSEIANNNFSFGLPVPIVAPILNVFTQAAGSSSNTDTKIGLLLGIGFEQFVYQDLVSLNVEYDYVNYGSVDTGPAQLFGSVSTSIFGFQVPALSRSGVPLPATTQASSNATVNSILGGINFYFGRHWFGGMFGGGY